MGTERRVRVVFVAAVCGVLGLAGMAMGAVKPPPQAEWDAANAALKGTDKAAIDASVVKIRGWMAGGWISRDLWVVWLPGLMNNRMYDVAAEFAQTGVMGRPNPDSIGPLLEFRIKALLALDKGEEALAAAKSYYNACELKGTGKAVELVGTCLAKVRADDPEAVRKFRDEQAKASAGTPVEGEATLKSVKIDAKAYDLALGTWLGKTRFIDRMCYGDLLLAADKSADAEKLFKELFQLATTQEELTMATEGIAKSLRAEDGNVARANAWLVALQHGEGVRSLPSAAAATKPGGAKDAAMP